MLSDQDLRDLAAGLKMLEQYLPKAHRVVMKALALLDEKQSEEAQKRQAAMGKVANAMRVLEAAKDGLTAYHAERNARAASGKVVAFDVHGLVKHRNAVSEAERRLKWARSEAHAQGYYTGGKKASPPRT